MKLMHATLAVALCCMTVQTIGSVTWSMTTTSLFPLNGVVNGHFVGINPFVLVDVKTGAASNITWPAPLSQGAGLLFTSENRYVIYQAQEPVVATAFYDSVTRSGWVSAENLSCAVIASPVTGFTTKAAKNLVLVPSQGFVNPGSGWFPAVFVAAFDMATGASAYPPAAPYNQQFVVGRPHLARDDAYAAWLVPSASGVNVSLLDAATGNTMWAQSIVAPLSAGMSVAEVSSPLVTDVNVVFSVWTVGATQNTSVTILYALSKATGAVEVVHSLRASAGCSFVANSTNVKEKTLVLSCMTAPPPNEFFAAGSVQKLYYTNFSVVWKRSIDHPTDTTSYDATANIITTFSFYHVFYLDAADGKIVWSSGNGGYAVQMAYSWGRQGLVLNQTNPTLTLYSISL